MSEIDNQLKKGVLSIMVLKLINDKDMYGYEIIEALDSLSLGYYKLKEGTLYPILYRLEDSGFIENYRLFNENERKVPRKYYKITTAGKEALISQINVWTNFTHVTNIVLEIGGNEDEK